MGFKTRRSKTHQGNDHAKKRTQVHVEPSSTSPSDDAVPMGKQPDGQTSSSVEVVERADEQMMAMFELGEEGVGEAVTTDEANVIGKQVDL